MFGASPQDISYFKGLGMEQAVDALLNPVAALPSPPVKEYNSSGTNRPDANIVPGTTWVNDYNDDGGLQSLRIDSFKKWSIGLMINQDRSIREKMTLFWHNHCAT